MSDAPLRAAIVGAGLMGRWHAHTLARVGACVVAVADTDSQRAAQFARAHRAQAFVSLDELLARTQVDVVHICTPLETHVACAMRALEAGAHALIEKPLAADARSTEQLLSCARERGRIVQPVHQFVFQVGLQRALTQLARIAPLVHIAFSAFTAGGSDDQLVADVLPHALALFACVAPSSLDSAAWQTQHPRAGELRAWAEVNECSLAINISTHARPTQNQLSIVGARGTIDCDLYHGFALFERGDVSRAHKLVRPFALSLRTFAAASINLAARALTREPAYPGLRALICKFYAAIRAGTTAPFSDEDILAVARARDVLMARLATA